MKKKGFKNLSLWQKSISLNKYDRLIFIFLGSVQHQFHLLHRYNRNLSNLCKNDLNTVLGRNLFSIANDCFINLSNLSKILVKKEMNYFDVALDHAWKVPILQELLNTRKNNLYVEGFDDYMKTEMINILCNE